MSWFEPQPEHKPVLDALTFFGWVAEQLAQGKTAVADHGELAAHLETLREFVRQAMSGELCPDEDDLSSVDPERFNDEDLYGFHVDRLVPEDDN